MKGLKGQNLFGQQTVAFTMGTGLQQNLQVEHPSLSESSVAKAQRGLQIPEF
jgi:hypothetical protein